jgi:hypothetical protein
MSGWSAKRWLRTFRATGGMVWLGPSGMGVGWWVKGRSIAERDEARRLSAQLFDHPLRYDAACLQVAWSG